MKVSPAFPFAALIGNPPSLLSRSGAGFCTWGTHMVGSVPRYPHSRPRSVPRAPLKPRLPNTIGSNALFFKICQIQAFGDGRCSALSKGAWTISAPSAGTHPGCRQHRAPHRGGHHWEKALARFCSSDCERVSGLFQAERVGGPGGIQATGRLATPAPRRTAWLLKANYTSIIDVTQLLISPPPPSAPHPRFPGS